MPRPPPRGCAGWTFQELRPGEAYHSLIYDWPTHADVGADAAAGIDRALEDIPLSISSGAEPPSEFDLDNQNRSANRGSRDSLLALRSYKEVVDPDAARDGSLWEKLRSRVIGETPCVPCPRPVAWIQVLAITLAIVSFMLNILTLSGVSIGAARSVHVVVNGTSLQCVEE